MIQIFAQFCFLTLFVTALYIMSWHNFVWNFFVLLLHEYFWLDSCYHSVPTTYHLLTVVTGCELPGLLKVRLQKPHVYG